MKRMFAVVMLALFSFAPAVAHAASFTDEQKADLQRISTYFKGVSTLSAHFVQTGSDGKSQDGTFYMKRPGRLRLDYTKPSPLLVVSDGSTIAITNSARHSTERYPLLDSPLRVLLSNDVDLQTDSRIAGVTRGSGTLSLVARQDSGAAKGQITLTFADSGSALELKQWDLVNAQGEHTVITLSDVKTGMDLASNLFVVQELSPFSNGEH